MRERGAASNAVAVVDAEYCGYIGISTRSTPARLNCASACEMFGLP